MSLKQSAMKIKDKSQANTKGKKSQRKQGSSPATNLDQHFSLASSVDSTLDWKCVKCGCPANLTPVKRLGPDGQRNICNACYIRARAVKERGMRGSARPTTFKMNFRVPDVDPSHSLQRAFISQSPTAGFSRGSHPYMFQQQPISPTQSYFQASQLLQYGSGNGLYVTSSGSTSPTQQLMNGFQFYDPSAINFNEQLVRDAVVVAERPSELPHLKDLNQDLSWALLGPDQISSAIQPRDDGRKGRAGM